MGTILCFLTFGFDCGSTDDTSYRYYDSPPAIEQPVGAIPEPTAGLLFGVGAVLAAAAVRRKE